MSPITSANEGRDSIMSIVRFGNANRDMSGRELVELISQKVPPQTQIDILRDTYPNGVIRGDEFNVGSLNGEPGKSLKIDINPRSPWFMKGNDFNGSSGVGGIVKILMEGRDMKLPEIKEFFSDYLDDTPRFLRDETLLLRLIL